MDNEMDGACVNHRGQQECMRNVFGTPAEPIRQAKCFLLNRTQCG